MRSDSTTMVFGLTWVGLYDSDLSEVQIAGVQRHFQGKLVGEGPQKVQLHYPFFAVWGNGAKWTFRVRQGFYKGSLQRGTPPKTKAWSNPKPLQGAGAGRVIRSPAKRGPLPRKINQAVRLSPGLTLSGAPGFLIVLLSWTVGSP